MSGLFGLFESRSPLNNPAVPLTDESLLTWLTGPSVDAGIAVTEHTAMGMTAVYRAVSLISCVGAAMPLHTYRPGTREPIDTRLLREPHPDLTPYELWRLAFAHRCLWGNGYLRKIRNRINEVVGLDPILPSRCTPERVPATTAAPTGKRFKVVNDWGTAEILGPFDVLHLPGLGYDGIKGYSPIELARQGIGLALAAERHGAKLFGSGNMLSGLLRTDQKLDQSQVEQMRARWRQMMQGPDNAHEVAILGSGAEFQSLQMPNDDAEFLASRRFQITEIARMYGVPAALLMDTDKQTSWGTAIEQQAIGWVKFDLHPVWLAPTEQRITRDLFLDTAQQPRDRYAKYVVEGLLRGDSRARAEFYNTMRNVGAFSANDIRELEDRPPVEGGDSRLQPLNMAPLGSTPDPDGGTGDDDEPAE